MHIYTLGKGEKGLWNESCNFVGGYNQLGVIFFFQG